MLPTTKEDCSSFISKTSGSLTHELPHLRDIKVIQSHSKSSFRLKDGVEVHFPYEKPYQVQFDIMSAVVDCVQNGVNGLIESPTGTGKTLSMLCSAIATIKSMRMQYRERQKAREKGKEGQSNEFEFENEDDTVATSDEPDIPTRIIYCTRTHSQITQIFDEIKTRLPYMLRVSPFASRKHSCIFESLPDDFPGNALNLSCKLLRKLNTIQQKMNRESSLTLVKRQVDIEDTVTILKTGCPFFYGYSFDKNSTTTSSSAKPDRSINHVVHSKLSWEQPYSVPDFVKLGQIHNACPYYMMRSRIAHCDLAVIPYNYLIDKNLRDQVELDLKNAVVIFDEGHNIEQYCEELYTFEMSVNDLFQTYQQLNQVWLKLQTEEQMLGEYQRHQVRGQRVDTKALCIFVLKMIDVLESYNLERTENKVIIHNMPQNMNVYRLPELFSLMSMVFGKLKDEKDMMLERMRKNRIKIGDGNICKLSDSNGILDQELSFIEKLEMFISILEKCIVESGQACKQLNKLYDCLLKIKVAYEHYQTQNGGVNSTKKGYYDFYVCIADEFIGPSQRRKLSLWCFNPSFAFQSLLEEKPRCVIFTSGTLAPLNTYASELETIFPVKLENDHVIPKDNNQVMVGIMTTDLANQKISFSFDKRDDSDFFISFAKTLARIFLNVPQGGILVFLPSYTVLKKVHKVWRQNKLYKELFKDRDIFIEPQGDQGKNSLLLEEYRQAINEKGRAVFIAVCRGKLSEGIDFMDNAARCVIMAGIPYPQIYDPKVVTKKDYLDRKFAQGKSQINGNAWYKLQACRAVNQAIGRVIRHVNDYGVIILMDERYKSHNIDISKWLQNRKKVYQYFPELETDLQQFFAKHGCTVEDEPSFKKAQYKQAKINGFLTKSAKALSKSDPKSQLNIRYEYDIPENPNADPNEPKSQLFSPDSLKGTFQETKGSMSLGFLKSSELTGQKRNSKFYQKQRQIGVMDDRDEGEMFVEKLGFNEENSRQDTIAQVPPQNIIATNTGRGGYKRRAYQPRGK